MSFAAAVFLGLGMGVKHALEADHLAAVCTLVAGDGSVSRAAKVGALWGLGHSAVLVLAGGLLVAVGASVPEPIAAALDLAVALMLILLGGAALRSMLSNAPKEAPKTGTLRRPIAVGLIHGASGTAALTLLAASTISVRLHAIAFVVLFGLASIAGMSLVAAAVAWPLKSAARRAPSAVRVLQGVAGVASIAAGLAILASVAGVL
ncbi:MAG: hypothetical protein HUU21_20650 [Polyangiaceae bacterium]|nr:hypothetical protein [Polyangiaceae bacterium]NUQ75957.1 hypothetical protein [Polyangiaceae bacterium]